MLRGGVVGLLDFGQCKELSAAQRRALAELYVALRRGPPARAAAALLALGVRTARDDDVASVAHHAAAMFGTATPQSAAFGAPLSFFFCFFGSVHARVLRSRVRCA